MSEASPNEQAQSEQAEQTQSEQTRAGQQQAEQAQTEQPQAGQQQTGQERSGDESPEREVPRFSTGGLPEPPPNVRDPWKGLRGVMAGTLVLEFVVFLLGLPVVGQLGGGASSAGFAIVAALAVLMLVAAFVQRTSWGLGFALVLQVAMVGCFLVHPGIGVMGLIFAGIWGYILYLRSDVARRMREGRLYDQLGHPPGYPPEQ